MDAEARARLATIRARHHEASWKYADAEPGAAHPCYGCGFSWPCDTSVALAAYDAAVERRPPGYRDHLDWVAWRCQGKITTWCKRLAVLLAESPGSAYTEYEG